MFIEKLLTLILEVLEATVSRAAEGGKGAKSLRALSSILISNELHFKNEINET